jgi:hypothetical protein
MFLPCCFDKIQRELASCSGLCGCKILHVIDGSQARGVRDILAVDLAQPMLDALERKHPPPPGNQPGVGDAVQAFVVEGVSPPPAPPLLGV